jgi:Flp pilus assembly protein TadG
MWQSPQSTCSGRRRGLRESGESAQLMNVATPKSMRSSRGQSLVETALMLPVLVLLVLNVVNLAYFFLVTTNLTAAARTAALTSIEGSYSPFALQEASSGPSGSTVTTTPGTVAYTAYQDLTGAVWNPTNSANTIQVCTQVNTNSTTNSGVNGTGAAQVSNCMACTSSGCTAANGYAGSPAPSADPEAPNFVLNQVDITYCFRTLVPGAIFNVPLQASAICRTGSVCGSGFCEFTRRARMRSMGP